MTMIAAIFSFCWRVTRSALAWVASRCQTWFFVFVRPVPLEFDDDDGSLAISRCWCRRLSVGFRQSAKCLKGSGDTICNSVNNYFWCPRNSATRVPRLSRPEP